MLPNFLIAGGVASGTSFLSATLAQHPDIYLPKIQRPEPNYFHYSHKYVNGIHWYENMWFSGVARQKAIGERSSLLLSSMMAAERIYNDLPDVKIIFCLRNPIERAWGNYRFTVLEGLEPLSFEEAIECERDRINAAEGIWAEVQPHAYLKRSKYGDDLQRYIDTIGKDNLLILKSEDLGQNPDSNLSRVCQFLGVDSKIKLPLPPNYSSPVVKDRLVQVDSRRYFGDRFSEIIESVRMEIDIECVSNNATDMEYLARLKNNLTTSKENIPVIMRKKLADLLADDIARVQTMLDFSTEDWK